MANRTYQRKSPQKESIEYVIVLGILRGLWWLVSWPFRGSGTKVKSNRKAAALDTQEIGRRWADIQTTVGLGGITHFGVAVVNADKLLDYVLKQKGYRGETMGERLRSAQDDFSPLVYNSIWQAHKLRNQLVHEVEGNVMSFQVKEAMASYEQALRELGALR